MKERNISIDILKFFAAVLITNSHMDMLYVPPFQKLATGGMIGAALFFFCSGFTLFLGSIGTFDNWYKRRINRIYPTVFACAILATALFGSQRNIIDVLLNGGGWFVSCIMIYYGVIYFVHKYALNRLTLVFFLLSVVFVVLFFVFSANGWYFNASGKALEKSKWITQSYFKWGYFFLFMLLGLMLSETKKKFVSRLVPDFLAMMAGIVMWYAVLLAGTRVELVASLQILGLIPLMAAIFYFYKVCNSDLMARVYNSRCGGLLIRSVGGLCLEIYLIQSFLFTDKMNGIFPLNLLIQFVAIVLAAYLLRCLARIFSQTFKDQDYDWSAVVKLY